MANASRPPSLDKLSTFLTRASKYGARIAIAVGATSELRCLVDRVQAAVDSTNVPVPVDVIPVSPWGKFVPALNTLLAHASVSECTLFLYQSLEVEAGSETVRVLRQHLGDEGVFVAGAALPGHAHAGHAKVLLAGNTTPWNTLALWRVCVLALTGFPSIADGLVEGASVGGVEEVSAIAVLQKLVPQKAGARLVRVPGIEWKVQFHDPARAEWHSKKMASKVSRPAAHLSALGLSDFGCVLHVRQN
jgi:hypothetical protein